MRATRQAQCEESEICRVLEELRNTPGILATISTSQARELALQKELRHTYPDELVRAALALHALRHKAVGKFSRAGEMWFDRVGLEQSTSEAVARHKAQRFSGDVDDLCCGIGGDTLALAAHCHHVRSIDLRPSLTLMTQWNSEACEVGPQVETLTGDVCRLVGKHRLVHLDPDRRSGARRSTRVEDYAPSLDFMHQLMQTAPGGAIKVSPASNFGGKFHDVEVELVSLGGECKEAIIWFGSLAEQNTWRATLLTSNLTISGDPLAQQAALLPLASYVYDPDPAVVRSGLLDAVACKLGLGRLDDEEEYLTGGELVKSGFVTPFLVVAELPFNDKQIRRYFREHPVGPLEIKCRHVPVDADRLRRKLSLTGTRPATLIVARVGGKSRALVCERVGD